jgi:segregation and condensation protein B
VSNTDSELDAAAEESIPIAGSDNPGESLQGDVSAGAMSDSASSAAGTGDSADVPEGEVDDPADPAASPPEGTDAAFEEAAAADAAGSPDLRNPGGSADGADSDETSESGASDVDDRPSPAARATDKSRPDLDDLDTLRATVEAVLFVSDSPVTVTALATGLQRPIPEIQAALAALGRELDERGSGVELREVGEGVRLYTRPTLAGWIEAFLMDGQRVRLTQAALETLAVIAYRQPVTRARISAIRGVNVDGVVRTLISRGLITEVGADPDTGGGMYRTTELFLEKMGLRSLDELPSLAPLLPELSGLESDELSG